MRSEKTIDLEKRGLVSSETTTLDLLFARLRKISDRQTHIFLVSIALAMIVCFVFIWAMSFRMDRYEAQMNTWRKETEGNLVIIVQDQQFQIEKLEDIIVDKRYIDIWGEFIKEVEKRGKSENKKDSNSTP